MSDITVKDGDMVVRDARIALLVSRFNSFVVESLLVDALRAQGREPALVAGVAIAAELPWLFFVLFAGAIADRVDRRTTMRNVQLLRVAVVGLMAVMALTDTLSLPVLYVAALALGIGETFFDISSPARRPSGSVFSRPSGKWNTSFPSRP